MQTNTWTHVFDAALCGLEELWSGHGSGGNSEVGPVIREIMRAKFAPGDFPVANPLNDYASFWGKPALAGSPRAHVSEVVISERDGNSGLSAEVRDDSLGYGLHK